MIERINVWIRNTLTFHHRVVARFLQQRGWVVFYLPEEQRLCAEDGVCWLSVYEGERRVDK